MLARLFLLLGCLLGGAGFTSAAPEAEPVPFETVQAPPGSWTRGPARQVVVRSADEAKAAGLDGLPAGAVDWEREMLVGVALGMRSTGGFSIRIVEVRRRTDAKGGGAFLEARVVSTEPAPEDVVTQAFTFPSHLIKLPRSAEPVRFVNLAPGPFESLRFSITHEPGSRRVGVTLRADGECVVHRVSPSSRLEPVKGRATETELAAIHAALQTARLGTIREPIGEGGDRFSIEVESYAPRLAGKTRGDASALGEHEARLRPLLAALEALADRVFP